MTRRSHRTPDHHLWEEVAAALRPLHRGARGKTPADALPKPALPAGRPAALVPAVVKRASAGPPPLTGLDRRTERRLGRGDVELEGRIDLHGTGIEMARARLGNFVGSARARGFRTILVITGKGASPFGHHTLHGSGHFHAPERQGKLRRLVPQWLDEPEFRAHVVGFQPAHPRHGGGGAFYVRLRRPH